MLKHVLLTATVTTAACLAIAGMSSVSNVSTASIEPPAAIDSHLVTVKVGETALTGAIAGHGCTTIEESRDRLRHELQICPEPGGLYGVQLKRDDNRGERLVRRTFHVRTKPKAGQAVPIASVVSAGDRLEVTLALE